MFFFLYNYYITCVSNYPFGLFLYNYSLRFVEDLTGLLLPRPRLPVLGERDLAPTLLPRASLERPRAEVSTFGLGCGTAESNVPSENPNFSIPCVNTLIFTFNTPDVFTRVTSLFFPCPTNLLS